MYNRFPTFFHLRPTCEVVVSEVWGIEDEKKWTQYSSLWYTIVTRGKAIQFDIAYSEGTMIQDVLSETSL